MEFAFFTLLGSILFWLRNAIIIRLCFLLEIFHWPGRRMQEPIIEWVNERAVKTCCEGFTVWLPQERTEEGG